MFKRAIVLLILIGLAVLVYFNYPMIKNYLNKEKNGKKIDVMNKEKNENIESDSEGLIDEEDANLPIIDDEIKDEIEKSGDTPNITAEDCDNECVNFKNNPGNLRYCQDICGLVQSISDNCSEKQGMDKDYCFKTEAISKTDLTICDSISDSKIKSSCKSRVTEDLLEKQ
jgi:hypothetical protein